MAQPKNNSVVNMLFDERLESVLPFISFESRSANSDTWKGIAIRWTLCPAEYIEWTVLVCVRGSHACVGHLRLVPQNVQSGSLSKYKCLAYAVVDWEIGDNSTMRSSTAPVICIALQDMASWKRQSFDLTHAAYWHRWNGDSSLAKLGNYLLMTTHAWNSHGIHNIDI